MPRSDQIARGFVQPIEESAETSRGSADSWSAMRFTLLELLAAITLFGLSCAALLYASPLWASILFSLILLSLLLSATRAIYVSGAARAQSIGFLFASSLYFLMAFGPGFSETVGPGLPTGSVSQEPLHKLISKEVRASTVKLPVGTRVSIKGQETYVAVPFESDFNRVYHSLGVLFFGLIGASLTRCLAIKMNREHREMADRAPEAPT